MKPKSQNKNQSQAPTNSTTAFFMAFIILFFVASITAVVVLVAIPRLAQNQFGPSVPLDNYQKFMLSFRLLRDQEKLTTIPSADPFDMTFFIENGENADKIAQRLQDKSLIPDADAFKNYLIYKGLDTTVQDGEHRLNSAFTPIEIAHALQDAVPGSVVIGMLPGWRLEEFAYSIESYGMGLSKDRFIELARNPVANQINTVLPLTGSSEGFLAPGNYLFERSNLSEEAILTALLMQFQNSLKDEWVQSYAEKGLSLSEAVIIASIIEKEAILTEEMPAIASVIFNRLEINMKLEMDSTTQYALGYDTATGNWWKNPLSLADLQVTSPYNTYSVNGLPAGPICSPSLDALEAVAFPETTPYYYFRAACDNSGAHNFSETLEQHESYQCP